MTNNKYLEIDNYFEQLTAEPQKIIGLYNQNFVNWSGPRSANDRFYSDYIAEKILNLEIPFTGNTKSKRGDYFVEGHDGAIDTFTNREEELFAKSLLGHRLEHLGRIIDYQMPLKAVRSDELGKVDLVSLNAATNTAHLIELKMVLKERTEETVLRAALEIETYFNALNRSTFEEYVCAKINERYNIKGQKKHKLADIDVKKMEIKKAILFAVDEHSNIPQELQEKYSDRYTNLKKLLRKIETDIFVMNYAYPVQQLTIA